jgi:hypothetical protein
MALNDIDKAFISEFIAGDFGLPIDHENSAYTPIEGTAYVEIKVVQNDVTFLTLNNSNQTDGVFRVHLRYPPNTGAVDAKDMADTIMDYFSMGGRITYNGQQVTITRHSRKLGDEQNNWFELIVSIGYRATI